jgi:hypothetical protein
LGSAIALLDRAWGRPAQAIALGISRKSLVEMSDAELLTIAALPLMAIRKRPTTATVRRRALQTWPWPPPAPTDRSKRTAN